MKTPAVLRAALAVFLAAAPVIAQKVPMSPVRAAAVSHSTGEDDDDTGGHPFLFGLAGGALSYDAGRDERALGAIVRWVPSNWFSLSATPTSVRAREAATGTLPATSRSGLTDLPVEATLSRGFAGVAWSPSVAGSLGVTLPVGDTASGLGSGEVGYSASGGVGFSPVEKVWVHIGAGRSLTRFSVQSAFSSGTGWGDISAGTSIAEHVEASVGFSSDIGAADSTLGRSRSLNGGVSFGVGRAGTVNVTGSRHLSGAAPSWSLTIGVGTAFPYLNHLGGSSPNSTLQQSFGAGTHGLGNGNSGKGTGTTNRGRGKKA